MSNEQKLREALSELMSIVSIHQSATRNNFAWAEMALASEALALPTAAPEMPLSMNQFGRLVELTREHLTDNTFVYKATSKAGDTCHFGVESAAKAWAKGGAVEAIKVREFKLHTSGPTADHIPDAGEKVADQAPNAGKMTNGLTQAETDASASVSGLTAAPVGERDAFEREMNCEEIWGHRSFKKKPDGRYANWCVDLMWDVWQARATLPTQQSAVDGLPGMEPVAWLISVPDEPDLGSWLSEEPGADYCKSEPLCAAAAVQQYKVDAQRWRYAMDWGTKDFAVCMRVGATGVCWEPIKTDGPIDAAMRKDQP